MKPLKQILTATEIMINESNEREYQKIIEKIRIDERQKIKEELLAEFPKENVYDEGETLDFTPEEKIELKSKFIGWNLSCREHRKVVEKL